MPRLLPVENHACDTVYGSERSAIVRDCLVVEPLRSKTRRPNAGTQNACVVFSALNPVDRDEMFAIKLPTKTSDRFSRTPETPRRARHSRIGWHRNVDRTDDN